MSTVKNVNINGTVSKLSAGVYDVTEQNNGKHYSGISDVLSQANTDIPTNDRFPGMQIKFIQTTSAKYTVVKTDGIVNQPIGTEIQSDPRMDSGTYEESQLNVAFSSLPDVLNSSITYYLTVTETTTYTTWKITLIQSSENNYMQYRYVGTSTANAVFTNVSNWTLDVTKKNISEDFLGVLSEIKNYPEADYTIKEDGTFGPNVNNKHVAIPVSEGETYYLISSTYSFCIALATSNSSSSGGVIPLVSGTNVTTISTIGQYYKIIIPTGCSYLLFSKKNSSISDFGVRCYKYQDRIETIVQLETSPLTEYYEDGSVYIHNIHIRRYNEIESTTIYIAQTIYPIDSSFCYVLTNQNTVVAKTDEQIDITKDIILLRYSYNYKKFYGGYLYADYIQKNLQKLNYLMPITIKTGYGISFETGQEWPASSRSCTDYIDISDYNGLVYTKHVVDSQRNILGIAFYDENKDYISESGIQGGQNAQYSGYVISYADIPQGAVYVRFTLLSKSSRGQFFFRDYTRDGNEKRMLNIKTDIEGLYDNTEELYDILSSEVPVEPFNSESSRVISSVDGSLKLLSGTSSTVSSFAIDPTKRYIASGRIGKTSNTCMIAYYEDDTFLGYEIGSGDSARDVVDYTLTIPINATIVKIAGNPNYQSAELTVLVFDKVKDVIKDVDVIQRDWDIPQIINNPIYRRTVSESIKILCFGSSWFMDTWWYLNKIIQSAGINAELHCYYIGHSRFEEWIELYKNDLTPFSGSEASRSASKSISVNGANWTVTTKNENYTAQLFRNDWYNDLVSEDWDIIAFQQGARQAPYWDLYWKNSWSELVKIIKTHCNPNTVIAFNSTWTPAVQNSEDLAPWPATKAGQMEWQEANWKNTKKFMNLSGIYNVSPNGKTMYLLRDSELNTETDLADDGLHPNNGLPIYALGGTFFETYIAPMFGISFKTVEWLPTSSTQKASVSKQTWTPVSSEDALVIKSIIRQALGDRFKF